MLYRTEYHSSKSDFLIDHNSRILSVGSCFSTHIADILARFKFNITNNPYGTIYNPITILESLTFRPEDFSSLEVARDSLWVNYLAHSDINAESVDELQEILESKSLKLESSIQKISHIVLTFGSAKVYEAIDRDGRIVANCHKQPSANFNDRYLKVEEILKSFEFAYSKIKESNSGAKFMLTVSPVRYTADGLAKSQYGKALLRIACEELSKQFKDVEYFPSYEIMLDDLRDYRYYEADLVHPNKQAIEYIWGKFSQKYISEDSLTLIGQIDKILKSIEHRAFNPRNPAYHQMLNKAKKTILSFPENLDFSSELEIIAKRMETGPT